MLTIKVGFAHVAVRCINSFARNLIAGRNFRDVALPIGLFDCKQRSDHRGMAFASQRAAWPGVDGLRNHDLVFLLGAKYRKATIQFLPASALLSHDTPALHIPQTPEALQKNCS